MKSAGLVYTVFAVAALIFGIAVPFGVHRAGSQVVPGWSGMVNPGPLSKAHGFAAGQCETCHTPHEGIRPQTCIACHAQTQFGDKQSTRFHVAVTTCTTCHIEHDGGVSLVRMDHAALAESGLWSGPVTVAAEAGAHPASAQRPLPWRPAVTGSLARLDCASCHSNRDRHRGFFGQDCGTCHSVQQWTIAEFLHPSARSTECVQCHLPPPSHRMMHFEMVSQSVAGKRASVEQCYACHVSDSWNNIKGKGWYKHH